MEWLALIFVLPYLLVLLKLYFNLKGVNQFSSFRSSEIRLSVVIACRNESENIKNVLSDISRQDYPPDLLEVVIVDDNSEDSTVEIVSGFVEIKNLRLLKNTGKGKKTAVTTGVKASSAELIITTDADCRMGKDWIRTIASFYNKHKPDMIICPVILEAGKGFFGKFQELEFLSLQGITTGSADGGTSTMCNGANLAFSRESFLKHSNNLHYEIPSGDDVFFLHSLKNERGTRIFWLESTEAMVMAAQAKSPVSYVRQRKRWISKGRAFSDRFTVFLAIITFVTILAELSALIAAVFIREFLWVFAAIVAIKSVPDFLILYNTTGRYGKRPLMKWFLPSQLVYPFFIIAVLLCPGRQEKWHVG